MTGVSQQRRACVARQRKRSARAQTLDQPWRDLTFIVVVIGKQTRSLNTKGGQQAACASGILAGDYLNRRQDFAPSTTDVFKGFQWALRPRTNNPA